MKHIAFAAILLLASCGSGPLSFLTGGGTNVAANVQAGAENNQTIGLRTTENNSIVRPRVQGDFDNSTQVVNQITPLTLFFAFLGWPMCLVAWVLRSPVDDLTASFGR